MFKSNDEKNRKEANRHLLRRMRNPNDSLVRYNAEQSWFQPRPSVKKDLKVVEQLYGGCEHSWELNEDAQLALQYACDVVVCKKCGCIRKKDSDQILKEGENTNGKKDT